MTAQQVMCCVHQPCLSQRALSMPWRVTGVCSGCVHCVLVMEQVNRLYCRLRTGGSGTVQISMSLHDAWAQHGCLQQVLPSHHNALFTYLHSHLVTFAGRQLLCSCYLEASP